MKVFAQFLELSTGMDWKDGKIINIPKKPIPACGTDSVFRLDARNNLTSQIMAAEKRIRQLKAVQTFIGFQIIRGERLTSTRVIYTKI